MQNYRNELWKFTQINNLNLPKFQRSVVWSTQQKKELFDTLKNGFPFGSILLYERKDKKSYEIIDGLQRISAMVDIVYNRKKYYDESFLNGSLETLKLKYCDYHNREITCEELNCFKEEVWKTFELCKDQNKYLDSLFDRVSDYNLCGEDDILEICDDIILKFRKDIDVENLTIPVILYTGDFDNLPKIFEKVNSTGTKLSRFDIFASVWSKHTYYIRDRKILETINKKYCDTANETNIHFSDYEDGDIFESKRVTLYEYCWALGNILQDEFKNIIDKQAANSIGFYILYACLCRKSKDMLNGMPGFLMRFDDGSHDNQAIDSLLLEAKSKIMECVSEVRRIMLRNFQLGNLNTFNFSLYQFVTIIATLFNIKYMITKDGRIEENKAIKEKYYDGFCKNVARIYLYEQIDGKGIKASFFATIEEVLQQEIKSNPYINPLPKSRMEVAVKTWCDMEAQKPSSMMISDKSKMFIVYLIKNSSSFSVDLACREYEITFAVPKKRLKANIKTGNFADLGNVVVIYKRKDNKDKTYYEWSGSKNEYDEDLSALFYPRYDELAVFSEPFGRQEYRRFFEARRAYLREEFLSRFAKNENGIV